MAKRRFWRIAKMTVLAYVIGCDFFNFKLCVLRDFKLFVLRDLIYLFVIFCLVVTKPQGKIIEADIIKINDHVNNINSGGCGIFAYNLYTRLDTIRYCIKSVDSGTHYLIFDNVENVFIDSNGWIDSIGLYLKYSFKEIETISSDSLLNRINQKEIWNNSYNRQQDSIIMNWVNSI